MEEDYLGLALKPNPVRRFVYKIGIDYFVVLIAAVVAVIVIGGVWFHTYPDSLQVLWKRITN